MEQGTIHLQDYMQVILRRRWIIITFFVVLVVTVLIGSLKQTPIYQATATLMIERKSPNVVSVQEVTPMGTSDYYAYKDYYETQYKLLKSRSLMAEVAGSLGWNKGGSDRENSKQVDRLLKAVNVVPIKNSQLVELSVENKDPKMAAHIANTIADGYISQNLEKNVRAANSAVTWLSKRIEEQKEKLRLSEAALQQYREKNNISVLPQLTSEQAIEEVKSEYSRLQAELANYQERYTDEHPKMIELRAQVKSLKDKMYGTENSNAGDKAAEYRVLEREVTNNKRIYEILDSRIKEIDLSANLDVNNVSIVDRAEVPEKPVKPNIPLNMVLAVMVGIFMGTGLGFFVDYLDVTIKSPNDVKESLKSYFLGGIPEIFAENMVDKDKIVHDKPSSPIAEAYRHIRTEILFLALKFKSVKAILVTSAEPQEGKTTTSVNLAIIFAQQEHKVLIVDSDLRKPQMHKVFGLEKGSGLSDYLIGEAGLDPIINGTEIKNLYVITAGSKTHNSAELLSLGKMKEFISSVK